MVPVMKRNNIESLFNLTIRLKLIQQETSMALMALSLVRNPNVLSSGHIGFLRSLGPLSFDQVLGALNGQEPSQANET